MHEGSILANSASERRRLERAGTDVETSDTHRSEAKGVETKIKAVDESNETNGKQSVEGKLEHVLKDLERSEQAEVSENTISSRLSEAFRELEAEEKREQRPLEKQLEDTFKELAVEEALEKRESASDTSTPEIEPAKAESHEAEIDSQEVKGKQQKSKRLSFRTMDEIDMAIAQHQHLEKSISPERYEECKLYVDVINQPDELSDSEIAHQYGVSEGKVKDWRNGRQTRLISHIERQEERRIEHESSVPSEVLEHRIDPKRVNDALSEIRKTGEISPRELTDAAERLYSIIETPRLGSVHYAELYDTKESLGTDWRRKLAKEIHANREEIERTLNERIGLAEDPSREVRIAVTDDRMYYWYKDSGPNKWLNVLEAEKIYFRSKEDKIELIDEAQRRLHIRGGPDVAQLYLNDMLGQLSKLENAAANRTFRYGIRHYLDGETLHFIKDTLGQSLDDLQPRLSHMGISHRGRIRNLKFPNIHEYRMKTVAIIASDGHLGLNGQLRYYEKNPERREIAIEQFREFGDFDVRSDGEDGIRNTLPMVIGSMMEYWGAPRGDKAIHNKGLAECIINESLEIKIKYYLPEMVSEDGSFSHGKFSITRGHVLHAGNKAKMYHKEFGIEPVVTSEHIDFVLEHGEEVKASLHYEDGDRIQLTVKELRKLGKSSDTTTATQARELATIVKNNPNRLLRDEVKYIIQPAGIEMGDERRYLIYYKESGRLSLSSSIRTRSVEDAVRWCLISPPNHPRKMIAVTKFLNERPDRASRIRQQIVEEGLVLHPTWEEHGQ